MFANPQRQSGTYTTHLHTVAAGDMRVAGLKPGAAGSRRLGNTWLSSLAGLFTVSPEISRVLPPAPVSIGLVTARRFVPPRPASETAFDALAAE